MKLASILPNSLANGVGTRSVVFFAGCNHGCVGCHNEKLWETGLGVEMSIVEVMEQILDNVPIINGVTLSGGEPFLQAKEASIIAQVAHREGLNVWCYTGYTYETLLGLSKTDVGVSLLLREVDVLVDGRYDKDLTEGAIKYTGSTNQRIIKLKEGIQIG